MMSKEELKEDRIARPLPEKNSIAEERGEKRRWGWWPAIGERKKGNPASPKRVIDDVRRQEGRKKKIEPLPTHRGEKKKKSSSDGGENRPCDGGEGGKKKGGGSAKLPRCASFRQRDDGGKKEKTSYFLLRGG